MKKIILTTIMLVSIITIGYAQNTTWFKNVTDSVGLGSVTVFRIMVTDVNNDNYPDLIIVKGGATDYTKDAMRIFINVQDTNSLNPLNRIFLDVTPISGVNDNVDPDSIGHRITNAVFADVNNDGNVDMITGNNTYNLETYNDNGDRGEVLLGDGTGKFTTVPNNGIHELGLNNPTGFSFLDYNKDGKLDLFEATFFLDYAGNVWNHGYLLKGNGDGTFTDVSTSSGISTKLEPMFGCSVVDWNNDGWPDIFTSPYCRTGGTLWKNNGNGTFTNSSVSANYNTKFMQGDGGQNLCTWTTAPEDFDNDGDMDLMLGLVHGGNDAGEGHSTIVINAGADSAYHLHWEMNRITWDVPKSSHHGDYDVSWLDFDNDGLEDIALTQGHYMLPTDRLYMFHQNPDHTFADVNAELGFIGDSTYKSTHASEPFDYDLDGDDDLIFSNTDINNKVHLLRNEIGNTKNWVSVKLLAPAGCNYNSIGARIFVYADSLVRMREVYAGRGDKCGQQPFILVFGLGDHTAIDSIVVHWPDSMFTVTTVKNSPINQLDILDVNGYASIPENKSDAPQNINLYPNPANDQFVLQGLNNYSMLNITAIEIYDISGRRIKNVSYYINNSNIAVVNISNLSKGVYVARLLAKSGGVISKQFIKI